ncbi:MAG TPA: ABC transporter permease subunit [Acetobacteraceae bacterium]|nr:ABC transporter permease subunit [Acetobacteraceae bacterium]
MSATVAQAPSRRTASSAAGRRVLDQLVIILVLLACWQGAYEYAGSVALSSPAETVAYAVAMLGKEWFWESAAATGLAFVYSLLIASVIGVLLGLVLGLWRFAADVTEPVLAALYTIPKVTLYPLILLLFGLGLSAKVAFGVIHGVIPITLFTLAAVKGLSPVLLRTARAMRLSPSKTILWVLTPAVLPEIFTGLRVGFSLTLLGVLIGEMFASQLGLGFLIVNGINLHNVPLTTAVVLIIVLVAVAANAALLALDRHLRRQR